MDEAAQQYRILYSGSPVELQSSVNGFLKRGWKINGTLIHFNHKNTDYTESGCFAQSIVRDRPERDKQDGHADN